MTPAPKTCLKCGKAFDIAGPHFRRPTPGKVGYYTCDNR